MAFAADYLKDLNRTLAALDAAAIGKAVLWLKEARNKERTVFVFGNGGSAAIASHFAVDLLKGASYGRGRRFKIISLADSPAILTAYANDVGPECVFAEQLRNFAKKDDVVVAISGSGDSRNVLEAVDYATSVGCRTIGMTRAGGGALKDRVQLSLAVSSDHMGRLEDAFMIMAHIIAYAFMDEAIE